MPLAIQHYIYMDIMVNDMPRAVYACMHVKERNDDEHIVQTHLPVLAILHHPYYDPHH